MSVKASGCQTWFLVSGSIREGHDLLEFIGQLGMGLQASVHPAGQVGDAVGTRQAEPGGEPAERVFAVAAAEPGSDGTSDVGISADRPVLIGPSRRVPTPH